MRPKCYRSFRLARLGIDAWNTKQCLNGREQWQQWLFASGEQIEGDDPLIGPRVEGDVTLEQHSHTGYTRGMEGVTVIGKHGKSSRLDSFLHGIGQA